jgi:hypothetical protein
VLERGEKLDDLVDRSNNLSSQSKMFYKTAKKVRLAYFVPLTGYLSLDCSKTLAAPSHNDLLYDTNVCLLNSCHRDRLVPIDTVSQSIVLYSSFFTQE